jgi:BTB/POZ domain
MLPTLFMILEMFFFSIEKSCEKMMRTSVASAVEWKRSGVYLIDQLHLFESGELYDCTLRVGPKLFKCHKLVLSVASCVFEAMFFGNFSESMIKRDEPLDIHNVTLGAFKCAMRFIIS